jgi:hypothetical protein
MLARRRWLLGMIFTSAIALPLAQGCGGDDASIGATPGDDGGGDESTTTTGGDSSTPGDGSTPQDSATQTPFCAAVAAYDTRCSLTDACDVARVAACSNDQAIASPGAITAYTACAAQEPCPGPSVSADSGTKAYDDCIAAHYGSPSSTLTTLVTDYCTRCGGANPSQCASGPVARALATYDDAILTEIENTCVAKDGGADDGGTGGKCAGFAKCARDIVVGADPPPAACNDN